ncbi:MAG: transketolase [Bacteroidetes bacterium]|nr:transketolase [Bacteroidota bacterium]
MTNGASSGHPGGSLGCADLLTYLFFEKMSHKPSNFSMDGIGEDLFFLSNGHISPVLYSVMARSGYFPVEEMATFRQIGSRLQGHPATLEKLPGVRIATGSLGQGLSVAIGAALAKKANGDVKTIFTLQGDGELQEGQNWEAFMFAAHHKVDNLIATIDYNSKQIDGSLDEVMSLGNLKAKLESFNWAVLEMDGHDFDAIHNTFTQATGMLGNGKPIAIIMKTEMGKGVNFMEGTHKWHGVAPNDEQLHNALAQLHSTLLDY